MPKPKITLLVDELSVLSLVTLAGLGLSLHFVLPPAAGAGRQVTLTWLGLDRHHWEMVYFLGILFVLALAAAHFVMHWAWYVKLYEEAVPNATLRNILAPLGAVAALLLLCLPPAGQAGRERSGDGGRAARHPASGAGCRDQNYGTCRGPTLPQGFRGQNRLALEGSAPENFPGASTGLSSG